MNVSDKNIKKLNEIKKAYYKDLQLEIAGKIAEDGTICVKLDTIEKDYTYFYTSSDFIIIVQKDGEITISDNFDRESALKANENNYNLIQCKKKITKEVLLAIERYNKINDKINSL